MTDLKITKKHLPTGSLARRILTVSIFLLVIPLLLQNLFLYYHEYDQELADAQDNLATFAEERVHLVKEMIEMDWNLLGAISKEEGPSPRNDVNVKRLYIQKIPLPKHVPREFALVSKNHDAILVGVQVSDTSALVVAVPFAAITRDIPGAQSMFISLVDQEGQIVWQNKTLPQHAKLITAQKSFENVDLSIQVSIEKNQVKRLRIETYFFHAATLLLSVGIFGGVAVYLLVRRIARPLKDLCKTMERVSEGAVHARYKSDRMGFEINELGLRFNETLDGLLQHEQEIAKERLKREMLAEELRIGHEIQSSLLPKKFIGITDIDIASAYFASKEVNGDFYDFFQLETGELLFIVCDTAGKGISACLFSLGLRSTIRAIAGTTSDISDLIRKVNDLYLVDAHASAMFSTLWLGLYDPKSKKLTYCSQGHPPAFVRKKGKILELWTKGIALGAQQIDVVQVKEITLEKHDLLLLYTDGVIEAHDPENQLFGKKRVSEFLLREKGKTSQQIADRLVNEIQLFSRGTAQHDDITFLVIQILN